MIEYEKLHKRSKKDPIPGTYESDRLYICKHCGVEAAVKIKPCCGEPYGAILCQKCGYRSQLQG